MSEPTQKISTPLQNRLTGPEQAPFFEKISQRLAQDKELEGETKIKLQDRETVITVEPLFDGGKRVIFKYVIDTNSDPQDGRIYFIDTFVFDRDEKYLEERFTRLFDYPRDTAFTNKLKKWADSYAVLGDPPVEAQRSFAENVARRALAGEEAPPEPVPPPAPLPPADAAPKSEPPPAPEKSKFELSGQANASYNYNLNNPPCTPTTQLGGNATLNPTGSCAPNNMLRVFDDQANSFYFNLFELAISAAPTDWLKFRADLNVGQDVHVVDSLGGGFIGTDEFGVQQAFMELTAPVGNGLTFKLGHFTTPLGQEVIESAYNWNTSRSFLFGYAIAFTHTGLLMTYPWSDDFSTMLGVVNGWDVAADNNKGKTLLGQLTGKPDDTLTLSLQGTLGPEQAGNDSNLRGLLDFVAAWNPSEEFSVAFNADVGKEEGLTDAGLFAEGFTHWWGAAVYTHWKPSDHFGWTLRGEYMQDDSSRLGPAIAASGACDVSGNSCTNFDVFDITNTLHFYIADGWEARLEHRHDHADQRVFPKSDAGTFANYQDTLSTEILYTF